MKKASILTMAQALAALLLTGCDNGNVSRRNDGIVDGTNGTNVATLPTINDATGESRHAGNESTGPHNPTDNTGASENHTETGHPNGTGSTENHESSIPSESTGTTIGGQVQGSRR